jgi:hypothetical protein
MTICVCGIPGIPIGKNNIKDPRLDQTHELVEAKKKVYAQVDVVGEEGSMEADSILATSDGLMDLLIKDIEMVETRLQRDPSDAERAALLKLQEELEAETPVSAAGLSDEERAELSAHGFHTSRPVVVVGDDERDDPDAVLVRGFAGSGYISYLTVGGSENRAWVIRDGATAAEAAGAIHTDLEKGFIRAEVIGFDDFLAAGGETEAKRAGHQRLEMKQYIVQDYDLMNIRANK